VFVQKVLDLRTRYNPQCTATQNEVKLDIWQNIESAFEEEEKINESRIGEITTLLKFSQSYVISVLTSFLDDFLASQYYLDWERNQQTVERENILRRSASLTKSRGSSACATPVFDPDLINSRYKEILLADDSAVTSKITSVMLTKAGFTVTKASHGRDALNLLCSDQPFGLALIDLYMPILDGFEAIEAFRKSAKKGKIGKTLSSIIALPCSLCNNAAAEEDRELLSAKSMTTGITANEDICIIGMSADENSTTRNRAFAAGVDYFLQKPFTMEKLFDILRDLHGGIPSIKRAASGVVQSPS
jgi:CheY-like chemotaxis protein